MYNRPSNVLTIVIFIRLLLLLSTDIHTIISLFLESAALNVTDGSDGVSHRLACRSLYLDVARPMNTNKEEQANKTTNVQTKQKSGISCVTSVSTLFDTCRTIIRSFASDYLHSASVCCVLNSLMITLKMSAEISVTGAAS